MECAVPKDSSGVYKLTTQPKGYVLLINIESFDNDKRPRRFGSKRDYVMLKGMWEDFGFKVIEYCNLNYKCFKDAVIKFTEMPVLSDVDSAIVFVMSHGKEVNDNPHAVNITTTDDRYISSDWIRERFSSQNCPALINKPKIIFFQACRGGLKDFGVQVNRFATFNTEMTVIANKVVPVMTDLLMVYPTLPGYVSQRDTSLGAWFVQQCISVFCRDSPRSDLLTMLNKVDREIRKKCLETMGALFQVVYYESWGFNKQLHFHYVKNNKRKKLDVLDSYPEYCNQSM